MIKYAFEFMSGVNGEEKFFDSKDEAIKEAEEYIDHLTSSELKKVEEAQVMMVDIEDQDIEDVNVYDCYNETVWDYRDHEVELYGLNETATYRDEDVMEIRLNNGDEYEEAAITADGRLIGYDDGKGEWVQLGMADSEGYEVI